MRLAFRLSVFCCQWFSKLSLVLIATLVSVLLHCCSIFGLSSRSKLPTEVPDGSPMRQSQNHYLGDKDRAFGWLDKAYRERSYLMAFFR